MRIMMTMVAASDVDSSSEGDNDDDSCPPHAH